MATFGDTGTGASADPIGPNGMLVTRFQAVGVAGTLAKLTVRLSGLAGGSGTEHVRGVVWNDSSGAVGTLLGVSPGFVTVTSGEAFSARDFTMSGETITSGNFYWLGIWCGPNTDTNLIQIGFDNVVGASRFNTANAYSDGGTPGTAPATSNDDSLDVFATVNAPGGGSRLALVGVGN